MFNTFILIYIIISLIIGEITFKRWRTESEFLDSTPNGDIGHYISPSDGMKRYETIHFAFTPSILYIAIKLLIYENKN